MDRWSWNLTSQRMPVLLCLILSLTSLIGAVPYSKFGRSCKDIGCLSSEVCVMAEEPCNLYSHNNCGRYPTCKKNTEAGEQTCTTMICPSGQYCRTENGKPTCVNTVPGLGYDSAGVSSVNGQRLDNTNHNGNPYANANAPPPPPPSYPVSNYPNNNAPYPSSSGNGGYPPYPKSDYPPQYPQTNQRGTPPPIRGSDLGYPPYPNQPPSQPPPPGYPPYQQYPPGTANGNGNQRYPNYPGQNYPYQNRNGYNSIYQKNNRRNSATTHGPSSASSSYVIGVLLLLLVRQAFLAS